MQEEIKKCKNCGDRFSIRPDDFGFYKKIGVPLPAWCPTCRFRLRSVYRNERTLYKDECGLCGKSIITMFNPHSGYLVYCNDCWKSDRWNPNDYGRDYDLSRPFFEQLGELIKKVPKQAMVNSSVAGANTNSEYTNFSGSNKDSYLIFNSGPGNENCSYSRGIIDSHDSLDIYYGNNLDRVYEGINISRSSGVVWGRNVVDSINSWFLLNCSSCQNCFGCVNLRHKSYCFLNEQLSKKDWEKRVSEIMGSYSRIESFKKEFEEFSLQFPRRENNNFKSFDSEGDYLTECRKCVDCFEVGFSENISYSFSAKRAKDCYDLLGHGRQGELILEGVSTGFSNRVIGGWNVENSHDIEYSFLVSMSENCIGCDSIRGGKFMILNKFYEETEYNKIRDHIVEELKNKDWYGLFLPPELSFFSYNESIGQDNLPLEKGEAITKGFRWQDNLPGTKNQETITPESIPDHINDVPDTILNEVLKCIACDRNYKLIKSELEIYKKMMIPAPRRCFNCRYTDRIHKRGPFKLYDRLCGKCRKSIRTSYAPDRPEIVYCEQCYNAEVV